MASIIEELIAVLGAELTLYKEFVPVCKEKTKIIVENKIDELNTINIKEQEYLDKIAILDKKREQVLRNVADVTGKKVSELNVATIIKMIDKQPKEQKELSIIYDGLKETTKLLLDINNHNKALIQQSLDMIEFNMNFIQSTWMQPGSNNYDNVANMNYGQQSTNTMFDAKQ